MQTIRQLERSDHDRAFPDSSGRRRRIKIVCDGLKLRIREWLEYDSILFRTLTAWLGIVAAFALYAAGMKTKSFMVITKIHRSAASRLASRIVELWMRSSEAEGGGGQGEVKRFGVQVYRRWIQEFPCTASTSRFFQNPWKLLESRVIVLKSSRPDERGAILLDYNFTFPLFARLFDIAAVSRRYHLVLEPGWSGYCTLEILCYTLLDSPVFVQSFEPRDAAFLRSLRSNLIPVPLATNWWVDHRVMRPLPNVDKDAEIVVVASWASYKRHERIFEALNRLKQMGEKPKTILIGYPIDRTGEDIARLAEYYGVRDLVEIHERIPLDRVNFHLNRSKVNLIWSRREGVNRAVIEGMFAGVPCVVREGFNYGYLYPYINEATGCYSSERDLPETLLAMIENHGRFEPRGWVMAHMTCQRSTAILNEAIRTVAIEAGERWTRDLAVKTAGLDGLKYWDPGDRERFENDYDFLRESLRDGA